MSGERIVLEGFAGPGGWSQGLSMLGVPYRSVGVEWDTAACLTAMAAGHCRVRADVARFCLDGFRHIWLLIMSPPCQAWSRAGKRKGILDQSAIFVHAQRVIASGEWIDYTDAGPLPAGEGDEGGTWHDARSPLVLEVLRWVLATEPENLALEQVPDVLPFWKLLARWLRDLGYNSWCGVLSAERYGVPQTRERAILTASKARAVSAPAPTHTAYDARLSDGGRWHGADDGLFGEGLAPWVSMADALGWVAASVVNTRGDRKTSGGNEFSAGRPSWALTEKTRSWVVRIPEAMGDVRMANGTIRSIECPAATITAAIDNGNTRWVFRGSNQAHAARRPVDHPAPVVNFSERSNKVEWIPEQTAADPATSGQRVTVAEAAVLQSFPADYPWQGSKSAQFRQVGDAVPPLLAAHVLAAVLGVRVESLAVAS